MSNPSIFLVQYAEAPVNTCTVWKTESAHLTNADAADEAHDLAENDDGTTVYRVVKCDSYEMKVTRTIRPAKK